jgi:N-acetylmuramoyl-L-alanine amidase
MRTQRRSQLISLAVVLFSAAWLGSCSDSTTSGDPWGTADAVPDTGGSLFDGFHSDLLLDVEEPDQTDTSVGACEFPSDPLPGAVGSSCVSAEDCDNNLCVDGPEGGICTFQCISCCPNGYKCLQNLVGSDNLYLCLPQLLALCYPCKTDAQCEGINAGALCIDYGAAGRFCGGSCANDADCPGQYACEMTDGSDGAAMQCVRKEGTCGCSPKAKADGAETVCTLANKSGACEGVRTCGAEGLSSCSAKVPEDETCNNLDDNCDGKTDEGMPDQDKDGTADCQDDDIDGDTWKNEKDCDPYDEKVHPEAEEVCNGKDDDCDGVTDNSFPDLDADGSADCVDLDKDGDGTPDAQDCAPLDKTIHPKAKEVCNGYDDNCNNKSDEEGADGCVESWPDADSDGFGAGLAASCWCPGEGVQQATKGGDCNDKNPQVNPDATEVCNTYDDDCDGKVDEEGSQDCTLYYTDLDADKYGDTNNSACLCVPSLAFPLLIAGDCNDKDKNQNPDAKEACNGKDDNCNAATDEQDAIGCSKWYTDQDKDGFGGPASACFCPGLAQEPYVNKTPGDCDDLRNDVYPKALEKCDTFDNDCDAQTDEGYQLGGACTAGAGNCLTNGKMVCNDQGNGTMCDAKPGSGQVESCNGIDDNCNQQIDEGCDDDFDGYCDKNMGYAGSPKCAKGGGDCNDMDSNVHPNGNETCNGQDDDCNGQVDGMTKACSTSCSQGIETCLNGSYQGCTAKQPECNAGPCCDGCSFIGSSTMCGSSAYETRTICSGTCGGTIRLEERWQYCTGSSSSCGTSNLKWLDKGAVQTCAGAALCQVSGANASCKTCTAGCSGGACNSQPTYTICIDPGFGGPTEPGALNTSKGLKESNLTLDIGNRLKDWLNADTANGSGGGTWKVVMTRTSDVYVAINTRVATCNNAGADRALTIYINDFTDWSANGVETYYKPSSTFASAVQSRQVAEMGFKDRGVKYSSGYGMLNGSNAPAAVCLPGFINHSADSTKLASTSGRNNIALAMLHAIQSSMGYGAFTP